MTDIENYSQLIDAIFGNSTTSFNTTLKHTNNVTGALNNAQNSDFKANFIARLERLKNIYSNNPIYLREIIVQVNEIQSAKNWDGAFAELSAFDHLNSNQDYLFGPIKPNVTLRSSRSLAGEMGKQESNLDGFLEQHRIYFDVKCLKDNVNEILEGIYQEFKKKYLCTTEIGIIAEYALDITYEDLQTNRGQLLTEMKDNITVLKKQTFLQSKIIKNLSYRIQWGAGLNSGIRTYDPFSHAENFHKTIFKYANKFLKSNPSLIVLVVFPWYNLTFTNFASINLSFYRSLSRRFFCQYKHDKSKFNTLIPTFTGTQSINTVSRHLSGIIILEDDTILSKNPNITNVKSYIYLNPNARKPIIRGMATTYLHSLNNEQYDDFVSDNY